MRERVDYAAAAAELYGMPQYCTAELYGKRKKKGIYNGVIVVCSNPRSSPP